MPVRVEERGFDSALVRLGAIRDGKLAMRGANAIARSFLDDTLDYIAEGKSFTDRGKHIKHIRWRPVDGGALVYTRARHLLYMEQGTGPHVIGPRARRQGRAIRFSAGGGVLLRNRVHHPGTRPVPFFFADLSARMARANQAAAKVLGDAVQGGNK